MEDDQIVSNTCVQSPIMEELHAAFSAISDLENCFLKNPIENVDFSQFHSQIKRLSIVATNFYARTPSVKEIEEELNSQNSPHFVPCCVEAYHFSHLSTPKLIEPNPVMPTKDFSPPPEEAENVQMLNYPIISSVQFSLIDERPQLLALIERIQSQKEIGVELICFSSPLLLSAICISLRECEYLIDVNEIPSAITDLKIVFENENCTKVFFNTARTCHLLHMFGIAHIRNVFCISAAACALKLPLSLEELTLEFRNRLVEGWIPDEQLKVSKPQVAPSKLETRLTKIVASIEAAAKDDWRMRPLSLSQMRIARQQMHYHLYLYDSLRLKLKELKPNALNDVFLISQHKASLDWSKYRHCLNCPNSMILCSIYQQPLPNATLFRSLMGLKQMYSDILSDQVILSIALDVPTSEEALRKAIETATPPSQYIFAKKSIQLSLQFQHSIFSATSKIPSSQNKSSNTAKKPKTLDETIMELGWVQNNDTAQSPKQQPIDFRLETTVSPRLVKLGNGGHTTAGAYLRYLRDPDQPTSVSLQIDGIPRTEAKIYQLANNVRMIQKLQGKTKAKLPSGKDEPITEETPDEILNKLVNIGYIDNDEAKKIKDRISVPKQQRTGTKRARSSESKAQLQRRSQFKHNRP